MDLEYWVPDPETGEMRPLDSFPIIDLRDGWIRQGSFIRADFGELNLGIMCLPTDDELSLSREPDPTDSLVSEIESAMREPIDPA